MYSIKDALTELYKAGYAERIINKLIGYGTSEIGYRLGGTWAERKVSELLFEELKDIGLTDVCLESVPTESYELKGARVIVGEKIFTASQFPGYVGTLDQGITAPVIYAGKGRKKDYEKISNDEGFFNGKLILLDQDFDNLWCSWQVAEAMAHDAAGVILTTEEKGRGFYSYADDMLAANDGQFLDESIPTVYLSRKDARQIKKQLAEEQANELIITMVSNVNVTRIKDGGEGYNVLGKIKGSCTDGKMIVISAHQDAHLRAGADDTGAIAMVLCLVRAMIMVGYRPYYTIQVVFTSSEEYGISNTVFDWQRGMFCALKKHTDWSGKVVALLNNETMAEKGSRYRLFVPPELFQAVSDHFNELANTRPELVPNGYSIVEKITTIGDEWVAYASGIPSISTVANRDDYLSRYHSDYDRIDNIDFQMICNIAQVLFLFIEKLNTDYLPYDLSRGAKKLAKQYNDPSYCTKECGYVCDLSRYGLLSAGADNALINSFGETIEKFLQATSLIEKRKKYVTETMDEMNDFNTSLLNAYKKMIKTLVGLSVNQSTIYPYQQILMNVFGINVAIEELLKENINISRVLSGLEKVNQDPEGEFNFTKVGSEHSEQTYYKMRETYSAKETDWSILGKMPDMPDVLPTYNKIKEGITVDRQVIIKELILIKKEQISKLNKSLENMKNGIEEVIKELSYFKN